MYNYMKKMNIKFLKINLNIPCYLKKDELYFENIELNEKFNKRISFHYIYHIILKKRYSHYILKEDLLKSIPLLIDEFCNEYKSDRDIIKKYIYFINH